jgi:small subunit ribosomal protein S11
LNDGEAEVKIRKSTNSRNMSHGVWSIWATFNKMNIYFTDLQSNVVSWSSSGKCNFRGSRKLTADAAQVVMQEAGRVAISHRFQEVDVKVKGPAIGRDAAIRILQSVGLTVNTAMDTIPVPHKGCRPHKRRRIES